MDARSQGQANARCAAMLAEALARGCTPKAPRWCFASPGSRSTPLVLALDAHPAIRLQMVLDERAAAFAALGAAQALGRAAVTLCTSGSAAAHGLPAAMEARHAGVAMVLLTADRPAEAHGVSAAQTTPQARLYQDHAAYCVQLPAPLAGDAPAVQQVEGQWRLMGARALAEAERGAGGPVHVNAPFREPLGDGTWAAQDSLPAPVAYAARAPAAVSEAGLEALAACIARAERVAVVAGPLAMRRAGGSSGQGELVALCRQQHWPLWAEASANLPPATDTSGEVRVDLGDWLAEGGCGADDAPTLWLHVGLPVAGRALGAWLRTAPAVHAVLFDGSEPIDPAHRAEFVCEGDLAATLLALALRLPAPTASQQRYARQLEGRVSSARQQLAHACAARGAWFEGSALRQICADSPPGTWLVVGNSRCVRDLDTFGSTHEFSGTVVSRRGVSGIDGALAHAFGLALALPSHASVTVVLGDLTFLHDLQSLRLLATLPVRLEIFVLDNDGGDIFRALPIAQSAACDGARMERLFCTPQGFALGPAAAAMGARTWRCDDAEALAAARSRAREGTDGGVDVFWLPFSGEAREQRQRVLAAAKPLC